MPIRHRVSDTSGGVHLRGSRYNLRSDSASWYLSRLCKVSAGLRGNIFAVLRGLIIGANIVVKGQFWLCIVRGSLLVWEELFQAGAYDYSARTWRGSIVPQAPGEGLYFTCGLQGSCLPFVLLFHCPHEGRFLLPVLLGEAPLSVSSKASSRSFIHVRWLPLFSEYSLILKASLGGHHL